MLTVNLLSPEKQRDCAFRILFYRTKILLELALFFTLIIATIVIGTKLFLVNTILSLSTVTTVNVHTRDLERSVRRVNQMVTMLDHLNQETTPWSIFLTHLTDTIPPSITLTEMTVNKKTTPHLILKGKAATRTDLLVFKTALEKLPFITNLSFPIANLLTPKNIDWQLETNIVFSSLAKQ